MNKITILSNLKDICCLSIGAMLLAIAITSCNASVKSQLPNTNTQNDSQVSNTQNSDSAKQLQEQAVQVIRNYYSAIARRDYKQAYCAWQGDGVASKQSFEQFKRGFANTASVAVEIGKPGRLEGAAGSIYIEIPVKISAIATNRTPQHFRGSYVLRRVNNVPGSTLEQRQWHLYSAKITQVS